MSLRWFVVANWPPLGRVAAVLLRVTRSVVEQGRKGWTRSVACLLASTWPGRLLWVPSPFVLPKEEPAPQLFHGHKRRQHLHFARRRARLLRLGM